MYQFDLNVAADCSNIVNTQLLKIPFLLLKSSMNSRGPAVAQFGIEKTGGRVEAARMGPKKLTGTRILG